MLDPALLITYLTSAITCALSVSRSNRRRARKRSLKTPEGRQYSLSNRAPFLRGWGKGWVHLPAANHLKQTHSTEGFFFCLRNTRSWQIRRSKILKPKKRGSAKIRTTGGGDRRNSSSRTDHTHEGLAAQRVFIRTFQWWRVSLSMCWEF